MSADYEGMSEAEAMAELARLMWERYMKPRVSEELLNHSLDGYKAQVYSNNGDGTLTVIRPFDNTSMTLRCPPTLAESAEAGDQVLVIQLGDASNSFILCTTDLSGLGGGGGSIDFYGPEGIVADITVDRLLTSARIRKYILQDTSNDNFISIRDGYIQLITGSVSSQTAVQATNRDGQPLYWREAPVSHNADGYPTDAHGNQIYTTTRATSWPVYTYTYAEAVRAQFSFNQESGTFLPVLTIGEGDINGRTKGTLKKASDGLEFFFTDTNGDLNGLKMWDAGYLDLYKLRKPTALNFSGWDAGYFTETMDGGTTHSFLVDFDSQGRPIKITDGDGHETTVTW